MVFEGDRRFDIVVRLPRSVRARPRRAEEPAGVASATGAGTSTAERAPRASWRAFNFSEGPNQISRENGKRRIVVTANVRGRDIASVVADARAQIDARGQAAAGLLADWGGQFENLAAARQRLLIVVPACFVLIFLLLFSALGSARDALLVFSACRWR